VKLSWPVLVPIVLTAVLIVMLFVPTVVDPSYSRGTVRECNPTACYTVVQYDSISYEYGGWGALYQSGINTYFVGGLPPCPCPLGVTNCCIPPDAGIVWTIVWTILAADIASALFVTLVVLRRPG
jgi:hypothetical protein